MKSWIIGITFITTGVIMGFFAVETYVSGAHLHTPGYYIHRTPEFMSAIEGNTELTEKIEKEFIAAEAQINQIFQADLTATNTLGIFAIIHVLVGGLIIFFRPIKNKKSIQSELDNA